MADEQKVVQPVEVKPQAAEAPKEDPVKAEVELLKQKVSTYDGQLRKQGEELKRYKQLAEDQDAIKAALALFASQRGTQSQYEFDNTVKENQPDLLKQFEKIQEEARKKRQVEEFNSRVVEYQQRTQQAGLTQKDEAYWKIRKAVRDGDFEEADHLFDTLNKETPVVKKPEVDVDKLAEEKARAIIEKSGALPPNPGSPSPGTKYTLAQIEAMDVKEYIKTFPGGMAEVYAKMKTGEVKT